MHRTTTAAAAVLLAVLTAGCSNDNGDGGGDGKESKPAAAGLAKTWTPKLEQVTAGADDAVCNEVGDKACATHLTDIALVLGRV
ncbi:hypothetical protein ACGFOM_38225 [Streptomyces sp. NPDC048594]|uniref:hypothetical protein n=1 Tax=Streptomyces sp. NPDC048594 TaxID=3365575 RepID=UPI00371A05DA